MSTEHFPSLPGVTWRRKRTPIFKTLVHEVGSGDVRVALRDYPKWKWTLEHEMVRSEAEYPELQTLVGFFCARQGAYDSFLYVDPDDCDAVGQSLGTGDGDTTVFQFVRTWGAFTEPVFPLGGTPKIYHDDELVESGYTLGYTYGTLTYDVAPAEGVVITADFEYHWRVRFTQDEADFEQFMYQLYELKEVEFVTTK